MLIGMIYVLVFISIVNLTTLKLLTHREKIKRMIVYCSTLKCKHSRNTNENVPLNDCQMQLLKEVGVIVDDNMKKCTNSRSVSKLSVCVLHSHVVAVM